MDLFANRNKKIKIAGRYVKLESLNAKQGLESVLCMAKYMDNAASYLTALGDRSKKIRALAVVKMLNEVKGFDQFILDMIVISTGLDKSYIESDMTFEELITAFDTIWKLNKWNKFWEVAYSIQLVEEKNWLMWAFSEAKRLRKR